LRQVKYLEVFPEINSYYMVYYPSLVISIIYSDELVSN